MSGRGEAHLTPDAWRKTLGVSVLPSGWPAYVNGVSCDSRQVRPGQIFVAVRGTQTDGAAYIAEALKRGAAAVVAETAPTFRVEKPLVKVEDARVALARLAAELNGHPSRDLKVVGVTGTNGKTTVTVFIRQLLEACGLPCGLIGTVYYAFGSREIPSRRTTPGAAELQELLRSMREADCTHCAMEISSHAIDQKRIEALRLHTAVFTNLSQDHLDYHGDMESYYAVKARLFDVPDLQCRIVGEDESSLRLAAAHPGQVLRCGLGAENEVRADILHADRDGSLLRIRSPWGGGDVRLPIPGEHNVRNVLQALAAAMNAGAEWERCLAELQHLRSAPGRLEFIPSAIGRVVVDYAHTPDAIDNVLQTLRPLVKGRLILVFGCGGDRDRGKRAPMAARASERADLLLLTQDNPRTEDPNRIFADMLAGIPDGVRMEVIPDRSAAIARGIALLEEDDLLLIAGKGHETVQEFASHRVPFDDREVARACLRPRVDSVREGR